LFPNHITPKYHTKRLDSSFYTSLGRKIKAGLEALAARFALSFQLSTALQDYTLSHNSFPSNVSRLSLIVDQVLPTALEVNNTRRANISNIIITNSGGLRFDIYAGPFTKNDQLTAFPFADAFLYIADVPKVSRARYFPAFERGGRD
jgi:hypothetical protein